MPLGYRGGFQFVPYREITPPPSDETAALTLIRSVIDGTSAGSTTRWQSMRKSRQTRLPSGTTAALDCSPAFERHRRYQSARHRELLRTLETLRRCRGGIRNGEWGKRNGG